MRDIINCPLWINQQIPIVAPRYRVTGQYKLFIGIISLLLWCCVCNCPLNTDCFVAKATVFILVLFPVELSCLSIAIIYDTARKGGVFLLFLHQDISNTAIASILFILIFYCNRNLLNMSRPQEKTPQPFNPASFRSQFPALANGEIYLDSAATALKPAAVINATNRYYSDNGASVHRSASASAEYTTQLYERTRECVLDFLNAQGQGVIVWTKGTTEAINLVAQSYARSVLRPDDEIIVSEAEHHANLIPWLMVAQQTGAKIIRLPLDTHYLPDLTQLKRQINAKTALVAIGQMSNVTGGCVDLAEIVALAHAHQAVVVVDGAQGAVHSPPDISKLDIDFYAFSAHKLYGPTGTGALFINHRHLPLMPPWQGGGKMLSRASFDGFTPMPPPHCFEAGTPNIAGVLGLNAALTWLKDVDTRTAEEYANHLAELAEQKLSALPGFISYRIGPSPLLAFNFAGLHHSDVATLLSEQNITLRHGQHCAQPLMQAMGVPGTLRASFAPYNTESDVEALYQATVRALSVLSE